MSRGRIVPAIPDGIRNLLRALRSRNYRLFFFGQGVSLIGSWMTRIATSWLVYRLSGSVFLLGVVGFAGQLPTFLLAPLAGVLVDRWSRHRLLIITQVLAMLQSLALAALTLTGQITVWQILVLSVVQGLINAFDIPARQSFVIEMVEAREDLGNAIALNSSIFNGARLLGPSIAGLLIAGAGEGWCFLIDGVSYLAVIAALAAMRLTAVRRSAPHPPLWRQLTEGLGYAYRATPIRAVLTLVALVSLLGMPYAVLMPVFAKTILAGGAHTFGFLMGASGVGALAGGLYLAARRDVRGLGRVIPSATGVFGMGLIAFSCSRVLWLSLVLMAVIGFGMLVQMAASNTVLQTIVEDDKRGRVMSFYAMAFMGMAPFGSLLAGSLASRLGAPTTLIIGGAACIAGTLLLTRPLQSVQESLRRARGAPALAAGALAEGVERAVHLAVPPDD